jgi:RNA recognition motif-containing protein
MSTNIYVGNLSFEATADDLIQLFSKHGTVERAQVVSDRETGRSRGFGFVEMSQGGDAAISALNGAQHGGRTLTVNEAKPREERPRSGGYGGGGGRGGYAGRRERY